MNKKEIMKFGYDYAYMCGKEEFHTKNSNRIELLFVKEAERSPGWDKQSLKAYMKNEFGCYTMEDMPYPDNTKQYRWFAAGVNQAYTEMKAYEAEFEELDQYTEYDDLCDESDYERLRILSNVSIVLENKGIDKLIDSYYDGLKNLEKALDAIKKSRIYYALPDELPYVIKVKNK